MRDREGINVPKIHKEWREGLGLEPGSVWAMKLTL